MDPFYGPKIVRSFKMYMFKRLFWIEKVKALKRLEKSSSMLLKKHCSSQLHKNASLDYL